MQLFLKTKIEFESNWYFNDCSIRFGDWITPLSQEIDTNLDARKKIPAFLANDSGSDLEEVFTAKSNHRHTARICLWMCLQARSVWQTISVHTGRLHGTPAVGFLLGVFVFSHVSISIEREGNPVHGSLKMLMAVNCLTVICYVKLNLTRWIGVSHKIFFKTKQT